MKIKVSLHIHTAEDPKDFRVINYTIYDLINYAKEKNFKVLALTCHDGFAYKKEYGDYAQKKGILLIPGIELSLKRFFVSNNDVLVLNCNKDIEKVKNFNELRVYKKNNPEIFIIAAHPDFGFLESMGIKKLVKNIDLFDAIEHCWFYSKKINKNNKTEIVATEHNLPFVATSDIHSLKYFDTDYCLLDVGSLAIKEVFRAIRKKKYKNISRPKKFLELVRYFVIIEIKYWFNIWKRKK